MIEAVTVSASILSIVVFLYLSAYNQQCWAFRFPAGLIGAGSAMLSAGLSVGALVIACLGAALSGIGLILLGIFHFWRIA